MISFCPAGRDMEPSLRPLSMSETYLRQVLRALPEAQVCRQPAGEGVDCFMWGPSHYEAATTGVTVQVGHGVADKGNPARLARYYARTLVPNELTRDRLGKYRKRGIVGGIPMLDPLFDGRVPRLPREDKIRVLYAPTHGGRPDGRESGRSTWGNRDRVTSTLEVEGITLSTSAHPRHAGRVATQPEDWAWADVVVCDLGSPLHLAVALGIPVVVPPVDAPAPGSVEEFLLARVRRAGWDDLEAAVREAADDGPLSIEAEASPLVLDPELRGTSAQRWADVLRSL